MDLSRFQCATENLVKTLLQGEWAHLYKFTYILRPRHVLGIKNPCLIAMTAAEEKKTFFFPTADSDGILLHVTVPWKIRSNESEDPEKQVNNQEYLFYNLNF